MTVLETQVSDETQEQTAVTFGETPGFQVGILCTTSPEVAACPGRVVVHVDCANSSPVGSTRAMTMGSIAERTYSIVHRPC